VALQDSLKKSTTGIIASAESMRRGLISNSSVHDSQKIERSKERGFLPSIRLCSPSEHLCAPLLIGGGPWGSVEVKQFSLPLELSISLELELKLSFPRVHVRKHVSVICLAESHPRDNCYAFFPFLMSPRTQFEKGLRKDQDCLREL
jgi:hypothetical protein